MDIAQAAQTFSRLEYFVLQATNESALTAQAHVLLPAATHVESEGTFTNQDGITQRFREAYPGRADVRPHWQVGGQPGHRLRLSPGSSRPRATSSGSGRAKVPELATFDWDGLGPAGEGEAGHQPPGHRRRRAAPGLP